MQICVALQGKLENENERMLLTNKLRALREKGAEAQHFKKSGAGFTLKLMRMWHFDDQNLGNSYHKDCLRYDISEDKTTEEIQTLTTARGRAHIT